MVTQPGFRIHTGVGGLDYLSLLQPRPKRSLASRLSGYVPKRRKKGAPPPPTDSGGVSGEGSCICLLEATSPYSSPKETPQLGLWGGGESADGESWASFPAGDHSLSETVPVS
jgi:hypothetical protein